MTRLSVKQARAMGINIPGPAPKSRAQPKVQLHQVQWDATAIPGGVWLQIPQIPPSLNEWKNWHWSRQSRYKQELTDAIKLLTLAARLPKYERATVLIKYYFPDGRARDKDNYSGKFLLDAIRYAGIIADDNSGVIDLPEPVFEVDQLRPRVEVFIWEKV